MILYIFLSHDVDWRKQGPAKEHIIARSQRFEKSVLDKVQSENLYYNFPELMDLEERLSLRSTFFFRTHYENGNYLDYEDEIKSLLDGNWEIGLHMDGQSINNLDLIKNEKSNLEILTKKPIYGNRVHYLNFDDKLLSNLFQAGFTYDSTMKKYKYRTSIDDMNYRKMNEIIEFPITIMDTYLFTYLGVTEKNILNIFKEAISTARDTNNSKDVKIITLLWHDNVIKMIGGRKYKDILEFLVSEKNIEIKRGIDL
ncbi:MAG TPA: hypothetical protein VJ697_13360, partial [Nitrososphaeraceae archaeon]|nr:hypothetical protein [Nitrososphaeraceae archaeon]